MSGRRGATSSRGVGLRKVLAAAVVWIGVPVWSGLVAQEVPAPGQWTMVEAVRAARARYPGVATARAGLERAEAAEAEARATRLPFATADASLTRFQEPMVVAPIHGFTPGSLPEFDETLVQGGLSLGYTVWDGGARGARIRRAGAMAGVAGAAVEAVALSVMQQAAGAYLRVLSLAEVLAAHDQRGRALESERRRAEQLLEEGRAARVQLLRAEAALSRARADREVTAAQLDLARRDLARLTGLPADSLTAGRLVPVSWSEEEVPEREALIARATSASPELARARRSLEAARTTADEVRARFFPTIQLASRYTEYGTTAGGFTGEWNAGLQLSYPLFTGGARFRALDRAAAEERSAEQELRLAELRVFRELDAALSALVSARARAEALEAAVEQSAEVARIERLALDAGAGVQTDYLAAEAELLRARAGLAEARHAAIGARIELARALGELSIEWIEDNVESHP